MSGSGNIGGGDANDAASDSPTSLNDKALAAPGRDEKQQQRSSQPSPRPPSSPSSAGSQRRRKKKRRTRLRGRGPDPRRGKRPTVAEPATAPLAHLAQSGRAPDCASSSRVKEKAPGAAAQYSTLMREAVLLPVVDSPQGGNPCTKGSWRLGATSLQMSQPRHKSESQATAGGSRTCQARSCAYTAESLAWRADVCTGEPGASRLARAGAQVLAECRGRALRQRGV
jgi:hypothetical protein